jgi:uncharacterized protein
MRRHLVLFLRAPQRGRGKRRLAREIGDGAAVRFERLMLALLLRRLGHDRRWRLRLAVTPDRARPRGMTGNGQGTGDLGIRMRRAIARCPPGPVVLVGTDIPSLRAAHVAAAFGLLGNHEVVFGPATDGGFWLVGVRHRPRLFAGAVRWSSEDALADALAALPRRVAVGFAARLPDVDDIAAWRRLRPRRGF